MSLITTSNAFEILPDGGTNYGVSGMSAGGQNQNITKATVIAKLMLRIFVVLQWLLIKNWCTSTVYQFGTTDLEAIWDDLKLSNHLASIK